MNDDYDEPNDQEPDEEDFSDDVKEFAVARSTHPQTSHDAADSVTHIRVRQLAVMKTLHVFGPMTHEELILAYPTLFPNTKQSRSGLRARCSEVRDKGYVEDSGQRKLTKYNRGTIVWRLTEKGKAFWAQQEGGQPAT